uniref:Uncharacterized protein n=1 Tax=Rhizophora mucronata TaxID=61149 RepID=A0A2P2P9N8_RHIMU
MAPSKVHNLCMDDQLKTVHQLCAQASIATVHAEGSVFWHTLLHHSMTSKNLASDS